MRIWLKLLRIERRLTQEQVAEKAGITTQYYSYLEKGQRCPSVNVARAIGEILDFDWTFFYDKAQEIDKKIYVTKEYNKSVS